MMARVPKPPPTAEEIEVKLLETLRAAGGSMEQNDLRVAIDLHMRAAVLDAVIGDLARRKVILAETATTYRTSIRGHLIPVVATIYQVVDRQSRN